MKTISRIPDNFQPAGAIITACIAVVGLAAHSSVTAKSVTPVVPEIKWNAAIKHFQVDNDKFVGQRMTVKCPERTVRDKDDPIFGTGVYPSKTPICVAAMHTGATTKAGGNVTIQLNPGADSYKGSKNNGITSGDLPKTARSIVFIQGPNASADAIQKEYMPRLTWDAKFTATGLANRKLVGQRFTFKCPSAPADMRPRKIFGTDTYAFHSMVCRAAVHAGQITTTGGPVVVQLQQGKPKARLVGSERNGVKSSDSPGGDRNLVFVKARNQ